MKFQAWMNILVSIIMLVFSGYLLADSSLLSLDLLSNPNLNVAIELIRLLWGVVGVIYFLYYLYKGINVLFMKSAAVPSQKGTLKNKRTAKKRKK